MNKRLTVTVTGLVQGVGFRWFVQRVACTFGLTGYVRNLPDGGVEAVAEGDEQALERFAESLRQGPPGSRVKNVSLSWRKATGEYLSFEINH